RVRERHEDDREERRDAELGLGPVDLHHLRDHQEPDERERRRRRLGGNHVDDGREEDRQQERHAGHDGREAGARSEEHTSELQSLPTRRSSDLEYANGMKMIVKNAGMPSSGLDQSISTTCEIIRNPTNASAGDAASEGTMLMTGARKIASRNATPVTTDARPV